MAIALTGNLIIQVEDEELDISAEEFSLEEEDMRPLGEGDEQYEALFIYFDPEDRFKIQMQATEFEGNIKLFELKIHRLYDFEGSIEILADQIDGATCE